MQHRALSTLLFFAACSTPPAAPDTVAAPLLSELGQHHFAITTTSATAQLRFDEGIAWCYGFHHDEASRCFAAAAAADAKCAMAQWGLAYAAGPHINNMEMSPEAAEQAAAAAQRAVALATGTSAVEQALIAAIATRYVSPPPADRKQLDHAYAEAMRSVYRIHGDHPDVAALFAEALMDLRPWDLWQADGSAQPGTQEVLDVLERLLAAHPEHPQANHLYIHAVEASPHPERAIASAERLRTLTPAIGHLVHMPAHAFLRVGRYEDAAEANRRGIAADLRIVARTGRTGFYEIYRAHNYHFLAYAAMFTGRADEALAAARELVSELPAEVVQAMPAFLDGFLAVPYHVLVRFGRWQQMLNEPEPPAWQKSCRAFFHYGRGIAFAALGRVDEAAHERELFVAAAAEVPEEWTLGNNPMRSVLAIGDAMLAGELAFRRGDPDAAFAALRTAVERDEALRYDEPWGWMMPPRHALGALMLEAGRVEQAEQVYRADLARHPDNGWALQGLAECMTRQGQAEAAAAVMHRFEVAWQHATVQISASCFCRRSG